MQQCETAFNFDKYIYCENSWTYFPPALHFRSSEFWYIIRWCAAVWCCTALYADSHTSLRQRAAVYVNAVDVLRGGFCNALWKVHIHSSYYGVPHWTKARNAAVRVGLHSPYTPTNACSRSVPCISSSWTQPPGHVDLLAVCLRRETANYGCLLYFWRLKAVPVRRTFFFFCTQ